MKNRKRPVILGIDIGNSAVKAARLEGGRISGGVRRQALKGLGRRSPKAIRTVIQPLVGSGGRTRPFDGAVISSVVPAWTAAAVAAAGRLTAHPPVVVTCQLVLPYDLDVPYPRTVGVDRLCCLAGAVGGRKRHAVVIDVGSAITVDLVLDRVFRGGMILAGPDLCLGSLASGTAKLPRLTISSGSGRKTAGRNIGTTSGAMLTGAGFQAVGGIKAAVRYLEGQAGRKLPRIVTGGGFQAISRLFPVKTWRHDPNLLMKGLYHIWDLNH